INCPESIPATGLELSSSYNFLRREAFTKYDQLKRGSNVFGTIGDYASIYAANSSFEDHLMAKVNKLIEIQQVMDQEARKVHLSSIELSKAYVDLTTEEIVGVDQALIRDNNYIRDIQTQISAYQSCIQSESLELNFEVQELKKALEQVSVLERNAATYFEKIFSDNFSGNQSQAFQINAANGWTQLDLSFSNSANIYL